MKKKDSKGFEEQQEARVKEILARMRSGNGADTLARPLWESEDSWPSKYREGKNKNEDQ